MSMIKESTVRTKDGRTIKGRVSEELWAGRRWVVVKPISSTMASARLDPAQVLEIIGPAGVLDMKVPVAVSIVIDRVADEFGVSRSELMAPTRGQANIALARQVAMFVLRKVHGYTFSRIGDILGKRDHGTIIHGFKRIEDLIDIRDQEIVNKVEAVLDNVKTDLSEIGIALSDGQRAGAVL
jgi:chromosomal replication initiator protein